MTRGGDNPPGDGTEDAEGTAEAIGDDGFDESLDDGRLRGWIPPEARTWRHPSELRHQSPGAGTPGVVGAPGDLDAPPRGWIPPEARTWRHPSEVAHLLAGSEAPGAETDTDEGDEETADANAPMRGWVPPEDRSWRHPSEVAHLFTGSGTPDRGADTDEGDEETADANAPMRGWVPPEDRSWRHPSEVAHLFTGTGSPEAVPETSAAADVTSPGELDPSLEQGPMRGWLSPDDRLWRHPSELPRQAAEAGTSGSASVQDAGMAPVVAIEARRSRRTWVTAIAGTGVAAMILAGGIFLAVRPGSGSGPPPRTVAVGLWRSTPVLSAARTTEGSKWASGIERSTVMLEGTTNGSQSGGAAESAGAPPDPDLLAVTRSDLGSGVVVGSNGLIATTVDIVRHASHLTAQTASGRELPATVIAEDPTSDIALVHVDASLPVARFVDDRHLETGATAYTLTLRPRAATSSSSGIGTRATVTEPPDWNWSTDTITAVGARVDAGTATGMAAITADAKVKAEAVPVLGNVLVDDDGDVMGLLDTSAGTASTATSSGSYLPAELVVGVADQLAEHGHVRHGWLGVAGRDFDNMPNELTEYSVGAQVTGVLHDSPATGILRVGDVITTINGEPVLSMADLRSRLYVLPPHSVVHIEFGRDRMLHRATIELGSAP